VSSDRGRRWAILVRLLRQVAGGKLGRIAFCIEVDGIGPRHSPGGRGGNGRQRTDAIDPISPSLGSAKIPTFRILGAGSGLLRQVLADSLSALTPSAHLHRPAERDSGRALLPGQAIVPSTRHMASAGCSSPRARRSSTSSARSQLKAALKWKVLRFCISLGRSELPWNAR
jgi:hypothetical protein